MTSNIMQRSGSVTRYGHRRTISPIVSHRPETPAGVARRRRRLEAEIGRLG